MNDYKETDRLVRLFNQRGETDSAFDEAMNDAKVIFGELTTN